MLVIISMSLLLSLVSDSIVSNPCTGCPLFWQLVAKWFLPLHSRQFLPQAGDFSLFFSCFVSQHMHRFTTGIVRLLFPFRIPIILLLLPVLSLVSTLRLAYLIYLFIVAAPSNLSYLQTCSFCTAADVDTFQKGEFSLL